MFQIMSTTTGVSHVVRRWMPAYAITLSCLSVVFLAIRLFSRLKHIGGRAGFDDVLITIGWAFGLAMTVLVIISTTTLEFNRHVYDVPPDLWVRGAFYGWWIEILFLLSTCTTKLSVLLFYRRIVSATYSRRYKWAIWLAMGFAVITTLAFIAILLTNCKPLRYTWDQFASGYVDHNECVRPSKMSAYSIISGALSVSSDFYSVMLPSLLLMKLHISTRQRIGLIFIFGLGYLVVGAGAVRTYYIGKVMGPELDKILDCFSAYAAAVAECNIGVVCASAPSLKSFSRHYLRSFSSKASGDNPTDSNDSGERDVGFNKEFKSSPTFESADSEKRGFFAQVTGFVRHNMAFRGTKQLPVAETLALHDNLSFGKIHKCGLDSITPAVQVYEDGTVTRLESASTPFVSSAVVDSSLQITSESDMRLAARRSSSGHPTTNVATPAAPSANIVVRPATPANSITTHTVIVRNTSQLYPRPRSFSQPVHHGKSPDQSPSPSFVFLPDENDESSLIRVRYRSYIDSSSEENIALSFPAMNPDVARAQSMRDKKERESQERQRKASLSEAERASQQPQQPTSQPGSIHSGIQAVRIQDGRRIDGVKTSRIESPTSSGPEKGDNDAGADDGEPDDLNFGINAHSTPLTETDFFDLPSPSMGRPHTSPLAAGVAVRPRSPASPVGSQYMPRLFSLPSQTGPRRSSLINDTSTSASANQGTTARAPNASNPYSNGIVRKFSLRTAVSNARGPGAPAYNYGVAVPWAPNGGRALGDFTAGSLAVRQSGEGLRPIENPKGKRVLSREKWRAQER